MACGITNKPKEQIVDIDAADVNNELAAVEYVEDMYSFYKLVEVYFIAIVPHLLHIFWLYFHHIFSLTVSFIFVGHAE